MYDVYITVLFLLVMCDGQIALLNYTISCVSV